MPTDRPTVPQPTNPSEQGHETDDTWPVIGAGPFTRAMAKGALLWGGVGTVAGALIGLLCSLIPLADLGWGARAALLVVIGALAGATAGVVYGGGREPEVEGDVGNQLGPSPLEGDRRDPDEVRAAVDEYVEQHDTPRAHRPDRARSSGPTSSSGRSR